MKKLPYYLMAMVLCLISTLGYANYGPLFKSSNLTSNHFVVRKYRPPSHQMQYDELFKRWTLVYLPQANYKMLKAVCKEESGLNPMAVSSAGARGLCQLMPRTYRSVSRSVRGVPANGAFVANHSIHASAYYLSRIHRSWRGTTSPDEVLKLTLASYNSGEGNIRRAKKLCGNSPSYARIMSCLPRVTHRHARETHHYVNKVMNTYAML